MLPYMHFEAPCAEELPTRIQPGGNLILGTRNPWKIKRRASNAQADTTFTREVPPSAVLLCTEMDSARPAALGFSTAAEHIPSSTVRLY